MWETRDNIPGRHHLTTVHGDWTPEEAAGQFVCDRIKDMKPGDKLIVERFDPSDGKAPFTVTTKQFTPDPPPVEGEDTASIVIRECKPTGRGYSLIGGISENFHPEDH